MDRSVRGRTRGALGAALFVSVVGTTVIAVPAAAQGAPDPGTYVLTVGADAATDDLQAGTYTLVIQGDHGYLSTEYVGVPGSICPFTLSGDAPDLTIAFGGDSYPLCSRTTTVVWRDLGSQIQFVHQTTEPQDWESRDKALFGGTLWASSTPAASAPVASPTPAASVPVAFVPTGIYHVDITEDDFAGRVPGGANLSGAVGTYELSFDPVSPHDDVLASGTFSLIQDGTVLGGCPFQVLSRGDGAVTLELQGTCDHDVVIRWLGDGDQLTMGWQSSQPSDQGVFDQVVFASRPWVQETFGGSPAPVASAAAVIAPADGTYQVRLKKGDIQPWATRSVANHWKTTTFTLTIDGATGSISDDNAKNDDFDAQLQVAGSPDGLRIVIPSRHTEIQTGWSQDADGTLTLIDPEVTSAMDVDLWRGVLSAKPWDRQGE